MTTEKSIQSVTRHRLAQAGLKRLRYPLEVYEAAQQLYNESPRPTWMSMELTLRQMYPAGSPSEGALRLWEKRGYITEDAEDAPWDFGSAEFSPEDERLILDWAQRRAWLTTRAHVHQPERRELYPWRPSRRLAYWIVRILRAAPELDRDNHHHMEWVETLARRAMGKAGPNGVGLVLALKPWRGGKHLESVTHSGLFGLPAGEAVAKDELYEFSLLTQIAFTATDATAITLHKPDGGEEEEENDGSE